MTKPPPLVERMSISVKKEGLGYTSELTIDNAQMEDRAVYVCRAFAKESEVIDEGQSHVHFFSSGADFIFKGGG